MWRGVNYFKNSTQDQQDYHKADPSVYFQLAKKLDNAGFDEISIEDAHRQNDLSLFDLFKKSKVSKEYLNLLNIADKC